LPDEPSSIILNRKRETIMKTIEKKELYEHLGAFLKAKGIELTDGSYAQGIEKACGFLADAVNLGQLGFERAKAGLDRKLDQVRQTIHEKTAPKAPPPQAPAAAAPTGNAAARKTRAPNSGAPRRPAKASRGRPRTK
jgi:hypothetical protein